MKILIGGGTGFIGRHVERELLHRGHTVKIISRQPGKNHITWKDLESDARLPECDAVVNLSGEYILNPFRLWNEQYKKDIYESRIGTNRTLVKLMTAATKKPDVWVSAHAEGIYPRGSETEYDESFVLHKPTGNYGQRLCVEWEKSALLAENVNIRHVGVRIGLVLGRDGGFIQQVWWPFWFGLGGKVGSGEQIFSWIHINDCANIFVRAIENQQTHGYLNAVAPGTCNNAQFTRAFGSALNRPTIFPVPEFVIKLATGPDRSPFILEGSRIVPKRTLESGYKFQFSNIEDAMKDIVNS